MNYCREHTFWLSNWCCKVSGSNSPLSALPESKKSFTRFFCVALCLHWGHDFDLRNKIIEQYATHTKLLRKYQYSTEIIHETKILLIQLAGEYCILNAIFHLNLGTIQNYDVVGDQGGTAYEREDYTGKWKKSAKLHYMRPNGNTVQNRERCKLIYTGTVLVILSKGNSRCEWVISVDTA